MADRGFVIGEALLALPYHRLGKPYLSQKEIDTARTVLNVSVHD